MRLFFITLAFSIAGAMSSAGAESRAPVTGAPAPAVSGPTFSYADLADLALTAPIAAHVGVVRALPVRREQAVGVPAGMARLYVQADVIGLIHGAAGVPSRISYVVDLPRDAKGRAPAIRKGSAFLLLAAPVPGRPSELRLVAPDAHIAWTAERAEQLRAILQEAASAGAAPRITGVGRAFHVPGSLPGESETQIFLQAADGRPVSLNVLRRPGQTPRWSVALSEIVDDAAAAPQSQSLLWYRLACTLPRALPAQSLAEAEPEAAAAIRADYALVIAGLGPCVRSRARASGQNEASSTPTPAQSG